MNHLLHPEADEEFAGAVRYLAAMNVNAIVGGKLIKLKLSPGLAAAWKQNKGRRMNETEAVRFVETKRREHALRQASP